MPQPAVQPQTSTRSLTTSQHSASTLSPHGQPLSEAHATFRDVRPSLPTRCPFEGFNQTPCRRQERVNHTGDGQLLPRNVRAPDRLTFAILLSLDPEQILSILRPRPRVVSQWTRQKYPDVRCQSLCFTNFIIGTPFSRSPGMK